MTEHQLWTDDDGRDIFGCDHMDDDCSIDVEPAYCPFCGINLGTNDIERLEWPDESTVGGLGKEWASS